MSDGDRYVVISADTHGGTRSDGYRDYVDPAFRGDFDEWLAYHEVPIQRFRDAINRTIRGVKMVDESAGEVDLFWDRFTLGLDKDADWWVRTQEDDGVVAGVIFPGGSLETLHPFSGDLAQDPSNPAPFDDFEHRWEGARAYNRWLADYCSAYPERLFGIAMIPTLADVAAAVDEIEGAAKAGLRGGVTIQGALDLDLPPLHDPSYDPVWAACAAHNMPVNAHLGFGRISDARLYGRGALAAVIAGLDGDWQAHRPLGQLIFSGAFERHPDLRLVFSEQSADWIPPELERLEKAYTRRSSSLLAGGADPLASLSSTPREYWARNCAVGATFMAPKEARMRHDIGVDTILYGTDFPHPETTYPYTLEHLKRTFAGVPEPEVRAMVADNAARIYGFDLDVLRPIAARVGPKVDDVAEPLVETPEHFHFFSNRDERAFD